MNQGGYLVSTSNGNIIRSSRTNAWAPLGNNTPNREINGPVGWTDDGLPFDASVSDLASALGAALSVSANQPSALGPDQPTAPDNGTAPENQSPGQDLASSPPASGIENGQDEAMNDAGNNEEAEGTVSSPLNVADGDQVASSLANGLRLSSDNDTNEDENEGAVADTSRGDGAPQDGAGEENQEGASGQVDDDEEEAVVDMDTQMTNRVDGEAETAAVIDTQEPNATGDADIPPENGNEETRVSDTNQADREQALPNSNGLVCPPDIDPEVFESLPVDMQQDLVSEHVATQELAAQVEGTSIDPDVLAELPEDVRNEILEQQRRERQAQERNEAPADPSRAEAMDNASFLASVEPELRNEILLTADESFLSTLPASIRAEADVLRERAMAQRRSVVDADGAARATLGTADAGESRSASESAIRRRHRIGKIKVDLDRAEIVPVPKYLSPPVAKADLELIAVMLYLLTPIRPQRLLHQLIYNLSTNMRLRVAVSGLLVALLRNDLTMTSVVLDDFRNIYKSPPDDWRSVIDYLFLESGAFPPKGLIGAVPQSEEAGMYHHSTNVSASLLRRKQGIGTAISAAASLPKSSGGPIQGSKTPLIVTNRILDVFLSLCKASPRFCLHMLEKNAESTVTLFDCLLDLLASPTFSKSASNLDHLLTLLETVVSPLSQLPRGKGEEQELAKSEIEAAEAAGKAYTDVPRIVVNQSRLKLLCSILRIEACRDTAFNKVNTIIRRLCRVEENRGYVLEELASVAHSLGADAGRDLRSLRIRMEQASVGKGDESAHASASAPGSNAATSVALSTSLSESKLLRVLQTLQLLCAAPGEDHSNRRHEATIIVTEELSHLLRQMQFDLLWDELSACLKVVHVLEGVHAADENPDEGDEESGDDPDRGGRKLRNSSAGLLSRFLPAIEAFLIANASATRSADQGEATEEEITLDNLVGGKRLIEFVSSNRVLLNALVRNNASLLDKGLRALVQVPRCRQFLEFDVKRSWFKAQMRRLRQHASRRHGSLRLHINRDRVFQEAYNYLRLRNADEMRGRLHVTFQNEEGIDAGGLSREFFAILAKEMFNPNYALFTATEDGCTFQPNQNSGINPDHMSFFRFVGRIVGKALADGYLLDAHFTRSLYKHMLGMQPTHHDMEAIDPDYYRNLKTILEYNLEDIGLDHLTFSIEERSFGRTQTIDLEPGGRNIPVTEENKKDYVNKICQYRMTTAIQNQIKAYLDGFHELINPELISIFTPRELELMISGLPDIDVDDLKKNTEYTGWRPVDKEIEWFWKVMYELSRDEKAKFLQFVTGSSKVPLAGFSELQGMRGTKKFTINKDSSGGSKGALMSAHTCFNTLDLPVYQSEDELREKLLYAINEGGGAFLFA
jgi:E3 ubiquitin-protein ligase HUWE1